MLIVGAKGFAKEVLEICHQNDNLDNLVFYDDINVHIDNKLFDRFNVIRNIDEAQEYFKLHDNQFTLGLGNPKLRFDLSQKFKNIGGILTSTISKGAEIGSYSVKINKGCNILSGSIISNDVTLGEGCVLYFNSLITHDCEIGDYVEISPSVSILGRAKIGSYSQIGASSTILPDVIIGRNVTIGAGAVVTKDIPDNSLAVGVPAKVVKELKPLSFKN
jgi:sugar O-acyltransferase (sialic acid O-acetyltransferase NeuD family)